ncbi:MAG: DNA repair exonuclease [Planctomycetes bacterium]|nr:DNA repair exonuclease [Planctomycetota bacterium]
MALEILAIGDLHLGRTPIGLPDGFAPRDFSPRAAWARAVEHAIEQRVDAVVVLGDVVDHDDDFIEAYDPLKHGVERLVRAEIEVLAVVGNHDVRVLPRLASEIGELRLLGRGGVWEEHRVEREGRGAVRFVGWSFPTKTVKHDPVESLTLRAEDGVATIGLVHGDLDDASSNYAPLARARLVAKRFDAWLLGHVHKPSLGGDRDRIGYLGSLVGLDPGEPGLHGPWRVRVDGPGRVHYEPLALAPIRWESAELLVTPEMDADAAQAMFVRAIEALRVASDREWGEAKLVAVRLSVVGSTRRSADILGRLREGLGQPIGAAPTFFLEAVLDRTRPDRDLAALAATDHPAAGLARRLLALQGAGDSAERERLIHAARGAIEPVRGKACFAELGATAPADAELAELLVQEGRELLELLLAPEGGAA